MQVRKVASKTIYSSTFLLPAWKDCLQELGCTERLIPRDVRMRWNSTYDMLHFILDHEKAYRWFTGDLYELQEYEWSIAKQLCMILEVLKRVTLYFSSSTPSLSNVIPMMDHINNKLTTAAINLDFPVSICTAAGLAKKTLNHYYSRTDEAEIYQIAMILHPKYKLQYFKNAEWEDSWIETAKEVL
ncbi:ribonuclease H-like domain-containing protein [Cyathus striatus]|nr:ribonuclease H-like domain-containing protein [Cyathus striatus]